MLLFLLLPPLIVLLLVLLTPLVAFVMSVWPRDMAASYDPGVAGLGEVDYYTFICLHPFPPNIF